MPRSSATCLCRSALVLSGCLCLTPLQAGDLVFADGFDIDLANAFFVSSGGDDAGAGSRAQPFQTITHAIAAAAADATRKNVIVAGGTYGESVTLASGVNVYGRYDSATWQRDPDNLTVIDGAAASGPHRRSVIAGGIVAATLFDGFVIYGALNNDSGGNSYAVYVSASNANLRLSHNVIFAGRGGPGLDGGGGGDGGSAVDGASYTSALDAFVATGSGACNASNNRAASGGGVRVCADLDDISGGNGGGNNCTPALSTQNSTAASPATSGQNGAAGAVGGAAGSRGFDASFNGTSCVVPTSGGSPLPQAGGNGSVGGDGNDAGGVAGCMATGGSVVAGHWVGGSGAAGGNGSNGAGGGGGGAGGGAFCSGGTCTKDELGGHGGGGGSGGCGAGGGGGGGAGGGAFAIFVNGGSAPTISANLLFLGDGGDGGRGGNGGIGALGGNGTEGGRIGALVCTGAGGRGGDGGSGGHGAGGGGGCGGVSFGVYTNGVGMPNYCTTAGNVFVGGAAGGAGGGGSSLGSAGGNGQAGAFAMCSFH